jgi:hypothetical protein
MHVLVGKVDLRHVPVLGNLPLGELRLQLAWIKPAIDIAHRRGCLERALANGFDGVAAPAFVLKNGLASRRQLAGLGGVQGCRQAQKQSGAETKAPQGETR